MGTYCVQVFNKTLKITMESRGISAERWGLLHLFPTDRGVHVAQTGHGQSRGSVKVSDTVGLR